MRFIVLASGSKGNATIIQAEGFNLLIDCGLSYREISSRMALAGLLPSDMGAVLLTHLHSDHIKGFPRFLENHHLEVHTRRKVFDIGFKAKWNKIKSLIEFNIGPFQILALDLPHDDGGSCGFVIKYQDLNLVYATDLGCPTEDLASALKFADATIIESNHDLEMLERSPYPEYVKGRIRSEYGHLSNCQSRELLTDSLALGCQHVVLAHISEKANTPDLALSSMQQAIRNKVSVAFQHKPTEWFSVFNSQTQLVANL